MREGFGRSRIYYLITPYAPPPRFEILVDWSRNEESKRLEMEEWRSSALQKMEETERSYSAQINALNHEVGVLGEALESSNLTNQRLKKDLETREAKLLETTKRLAVSEELSRSSTSECSALKSLSSKLEIELEGTRSRLKTVERERANELTKLEEEVKSLNVEIRRLSSEKDDAERGRREEEKRHGEETRRLEGEVGGRQKEVEGMRRQVKNLEGRVEGYSKNEKGLEARLDAVLQENEIMKRKVWEGEKSRRDADDLAARNERRVKELLGKNEELNRIIDGLEEEGGGKRRSMASGVGTSPSLLRYDVKPLY